MMKRKYAKSLLSLAHPGKVYRYRELAVYSKSASRDLNHLVKEGQLCKASGGLYYKPEKSRFGLLPPNDKNLVKTFLSDDYFLLVSYNDYNTLGLGLTQLYNHVIVYNRKRHGTFTLANKTFDFRRTYKGLPKTLTKEFLLVDLINNLNDLSEDTSKVKQHIKKKLCAFNLKRLKHLAKCHGKIATTQFFLSLLQ